MISEGATAPAFTAPVVGDDIETGSLTDVLEHDAPVVLAFFPGAFTGVCTHEMQAFRDRFDELTDAGGTLYGISIDTPFALAEFRDQLSLPFDLVSDVDRRIIEAYGVTTAFEDIGIDRLAARSVFVVDADRTVTYAWVGDNPGVEPDYDEVIGAVAATA